jgi:hypothetical protein
MKWMRRRKSRYRTLRGRMRRIRNSKRKVGRIWTKTNKGSVWRDNACLLQNRKFYGSEGFLVILTHPSGEQCLETR